MAIIRAPSPGSQPTDLMMSPVLLRDHARRAIHRRNLRQDLAVLLARFVFSAPTTTNWDQLATGHRAYCLDLADLILRNLEANGVDLEATAA